MEAPHILVGDLNVVHVVRVAPEMTLQEAARLLATSGAGTLVVDTTPLSELTEHDVVRAVAVGAPCDTKLADLARPLPGFVRPDAHLKEIASLLFESGRRSVVIIDDQGQPVGLLNLPSVTSALLGGPSWLGALRVALRVERPL